MKAGCEDTKTFMKERQEAMLAMARRDPKAFWRETTNKKTTTRE
jgi:hypothetical protein